MRRTDNRRRRLRAGAAILCGVCTRRECLARLRSNEVLNARSGLIAGFAGAVRPDSAFHARVIMHQRFILFIDIPEATSC